MAAGTAAAPPRRIRRGTATPGEPPSARGRSDTVTARFPAVPEMSEPVPAPAIPPASPTRSRRTTTSPPPPQLLSPFIDPQGSSKAEGGFARHNAQGNHARLDDTPDGRPPMLPLALQSLEAVIRLWINISPTASVDPRLLTHYTSLATTYSGTLAPVLRDVEELRPDLTGNFHFMFSLRIY